LGVAVTFLNRICPGVNAACNSIYRGVRLYGANGSARAWVGLLSHIVRSARGAALPTWINIALTYRCPCRCVHCYADGRSLPDEEELSTECVKSVVRQAWELGVLQVTFTGGEALLRGDLAELVTHAHGLGLITRVNTNGLLLSAARVAELRAAGLTHCGVSIDSADPDIHDRLRAVPGLHAKAIEAIGHLGDAGIPCELLTYASRRSLDSDLEAVVALGRELGVASVCISFPTALGRWAGALDERLTAEEKERVRALRDLTLVHVPVLPTARSLCRVFRRQLMHISAYGDFTPCPRVPYVVGNIRTHTLRDLWERFCSDLRMEFRGDCVTNDPKSSAELQQYIDAVAPAGRARRAI
jgi:MoaA/NifB/PqqE/SkfB family radical SAM enzyme